MEVEFFWHGERVGLSIRTPEVLRIGAIAVVEVPVAGARQREVDAAFLARSADGKQYGLELLRVERLGPDRARLVGFLRMRDR